MPVTRAPILPYKFITGSGNYYFLSPSAGTQTVTPTGDLCYCFPRFIPNPCVVTDIGCWVITGQAGSTARFAIYTDNGSFLPSTLVVDTGTVATTGTGATASVTLPIPVPLTAGNWWFGFVAHSSGTVASFDFEASNVGSFSFTYKTNPPTPGTSTFTPYGYTVTSTPAFPTTWTATANTAIIGTPVARLWIRIQ